MPDHLTRLLEATSVVPAVNQIEVHPYFRQSELLALGTEHGILNQAWSPIGGITFCRDGPHGSTLEDPGRRTRTSVALVTVCPVDGEPTQGIGRADRPAGPSPAHLRVRMSAAPHR